MPREEGYTPQEEEAEAIVTMKKGGKIPGANQEGDTTTQSQNGDMRPKKDKLQALAGLQAHPVTIRGSTYQNQDIEILEAGEKNPETEEIEEKEIDIIQDRKKSTQMKALAEMSEEEVPGGIMVQRGQSPMAIGRLPEVTARRFHAWGNL